MYIFHFFSCLPSFRGADPCPAGGPGERDVPAQARRAREAVDADADHQPLRASHRGRVRLHLPDGDQQVLLRTCACFCVRSAHTCVNVHERSDFIRAKYRIFFGLFISICPCFSIYA